LTGHLDDLGPSRHAESMHDAFRSSHLVGGILLTGGTSRRMGFDKASMLIDGVPCAARVARAMKAVVADAVEVGPGVSGLPAIHEAPRGGGPLVALCAGARALNEVGQVRAALVLACDLPLVTATLLRTLVHWPATRSIVPIVEGRPQPLCARWSAEDLATAMDLANSDKRSMHSLLDCSDVELIEVKRKRWPFEIDWREFSDVDTTTDLEETGLAWEIPQQLLSSQPPGVLG